VCGVSLTWPPEMQPYSRASAGGGSGLGYSRSSRECHSVESSMAPNGGVCVGSWLVTCSFSLISS